MTELGAILLPQRPPEDVLRVAAAAEAAGLAQLWLWEDCFLTSGVATAAAILAATERLHVGVGLLPVPLRNVALTAMELATLERLFPGRLLPGVGHGVLDWMSQVGVRVSSPMTLLGEYVDALQALLAGERVTVDGRYVKLDDVTLDWPPSAKPALYVGAMRPRTLALAGERADGVILTGLTTPAQVRAAHAVLEEAADRTGRPPARIVVFVLTTTGEHASDRLELEIARWSREPRGDGPAGVAGPADEIADGLHQWIAAGADTVVLQPALDEPDPAEFVHFAGAQVAPLL